MRTVNIYYFNAMFCIDFIRNGELIHISQRIKILPEEILDWLVAERLP